LRVAKQRFGLVAYIQRAFADQHFPFFFLSLVYDWTAVKVEFPNSSHAALLKINPFSYYRTAGRFLIIMIEN
jgi:hypothetical protein